LPAGETAAEIEDAGYAGASEGLLERKRGKLNGKTLNFL
jgi:hypothetical protein